MSISKAQRDVEVEKAALPNQEIAKERVPVREPQHFQVNVSEKLSIQES